MRASGRVIVLGEERIGHRRGRPRPGDQGRAHSRQSKPPAFARQMPKWVRIKLFNTGVGLTKAGEPDPHWQIVARTDDPNFKPRQAVATSVVSEWLANDSRSQWISLAADSWSPGNVTYKFRTTFELVGVLPRTAVLRGRLAADDRVRAIYLNGRKVFSPRRSRRRTRLGFVAMQPFSVTDGFVEGTNVLEFDVENFCRRRCPAGRLRWAFASSWNVLPSCPRPPRATCRTPMGRQFNCRPNRPQPAERRALYELTMPFRACKRTGCSNP